VKGLAKDKNVSGAIQLLAKKMIQRKNEPKKG
jgi:pentatricopeptide repeat protein